MKTYTEVQLNEILRNHMHWVLEDCDGWEGMRANLPEWCGEKITTMEQLGEVQTA